MFRPIQRPIYRAIASGLLTRPGGFSPVSLFADGSKGVLYDNNDLSSFYLDSAGTTAATVNGLVGLQLDKSANLALGAEIKSSGAIGLIGAATVATYNTTTGEGTATRVDASNQSYVQWSGLATGSWYLLTIQNTGANTLLVRSGASGGVPWLNVFTGETKTLYVPEGSGIVSVTSAVVGSVQFTVSTIKQAQGNHRYQTTTGSKPVLRGTPTGANLVTNGDFASGTGWTLGAGWSIGSGVATKVAGVATSLEWFTTVTTGKVYRVTYTLTVTAGAFQFALAGGTSVFGGLRSASGTYVDYLVGATGNDRFAMQTNAAAAGTVDNIEVVDVSAGQVTAPYGLQYDGVDDFMQTAAVDFTATDKMFVCAGVRKLSDVTQGILVELSANVNLNNGGFSVEAPRTAGVGNYGLFSKGTVLSGANVATYAAPVTNVVAGVFDIVADSLLIRVNGAQVGTSVTDQGTGNYGNHILYYGRRGGVGNPFTGLDFGLVICGKTLTSTQITQTERYVAQRTGISI